MRREAVLIAGEFWNSCLISKQAQETPRHQCCDKLTLNSAHLLRKAHIILLLKPPSTSTTVVVLKPEQMPAVICADAGRACAALLRGPFANLSTDPHQRCIKADSSAYVGRHLSQDILLWAKALLAHLRRP